MNTIEFSIDISNNCPFACQFCSSQNNSTLSDINLETIKKIIVSTNQLYNKKKRIVTITGGEPLVMSKIKLYNIIKTLTLNEFDVRICTTGAILLPAYYWKNLKKIGLKTIFLSLNAIKNNEAKKIYGNNYEFSIVDKNINNIIDAKILLNVNYLLTRQNSHLFKQIVEYCISKNIPKIRILGLARQGMAKLNWNTLSLTPKMEKFYIDKIINICKKLPINIVYAGLPDFKRCTHTDRTGNCIGGKYFFHINTQGDLYPCPSVKSIANEKMGNIFNKIEIRKKNKFPCNYNKYCV